MPAWIVERQSAPYESLLLGAAISLSDGLNGARCSPETSFPPNGGSWREPTFLHLSTNGLFWSAAARIADDLRLGRAIRTLRNLED